ncbi:hypothetical protein Aoki45_22590 [Algoriphagus sp. oki45]|uniref:DUF2442 domain-containing protein n=1 Tax=Algoriphagus sp. oki45 TaxID=3067294 RepID=UPI0027F76081|nr:hypothetical protein Aoki45_22590 [Algoriphagus sp. oki45]
MIIQVDKYQEDNPIIEVILATWIADYVLEIKFSDGKTNKVDFKKFLSNSSHPEIRKCLKQDYFKLFKIKDGNLIWNDYEMIFPIEDLYSGVIL